MVTTCRLMTTIPLVVVEVFVGSTLICWAGFFVQNFEIVELINVVHFRQLSVFVSFLHVSIHSVLSAAALTKHDEHWGEIVLSVLLKFSAILKHSTIPSRPLSNKHRCNTASDQVLYAKSAASSIEHFSTLPVE